MRITAMNIAGVSSVTRRTLGLGSSRRVADGVGRGAAAETVGDDGGRSVGGAAAVGAARVAPGVGWVGEPQSKQIASPID